MPRFCEKFLCIYDPLICCQGLPSAVAVPATGGPAKCLSLQLGALSVALQTRRVCMQKALGLILLQKTLQQQDLQIEEQQLINGMLLQQVARLLLVFKGHGITTSACCLLFCISRA